MSRQTARPSGAGGPGLPPHGAIRTLLRSVAGPSIRLHRYRVLHTRLREAAETEAARMDCDLPKAAGGQHE